VIVLAGGINRTGVFLHTYREYIKLDVAGCESVAMVIRQVCGAEICWQGCAL
jgi:hypothetical protein